MRKLGIVPVLFVVLIAAVVPAVAVTDSTAEASIEYLEAWQTPDDEVTLQNAGDIQSAIQDGTLSRATGLTANDTLVVELEIPGFEGAVDGANGSTETERFQNALSAHGDLEIHQTNMGPNQAPLRIDVFNSSGVTVFSEGDTYYAVVDISDARLMRNDIEDDLYHEKAYTFSIEATLSAESDVTDDGDTAATAVDERSVSVVTEPDGRLQFRPQPNQTIMGTTNLGTGSTVTLVLSGESNPETETDESFELTRRVTVGHPSDSYRYEGPFAGSFDLRSVPTAATNVTLDVRTDGESLLTEAVPVVLADRSATVSAIDVVNETGFAAVNVTAELSAGGFVVLHAGSGDGPVVGHSQYLDRGDHTVNVYLNQPTTTDKLVVVAYHDANYNEWFDGVDVEQAYPSEEPVDSILFDHSTDDSSESGDSGSDSGSDSSESTPDEDSQSDNESTPRNAGSGTDTSGGDESPGQSENPTDSSGDDSDSGSLLAGSLGGVYPLLVIGIFGFLLLAVGYVGSD